MAYTLRLIVLSLLLILVWSQCPYCQAGSCSVTFGSIGNCSACNPGSALMTVTTYLANSSQYGPWANLTLGICQTCPPGCVSCFITMLSPAMSTPIYAANCTSCLSGYTYDYMNGSCVLCSSHCAVCYCQMMCSSTTCSACYPNYYLVNNTCIYNSSSSVTITQESSSQEELNTGTIVGLAIWGSVMTIALGVVLFLFYKKTVTKPATLLGGEPETRTISF